MYIRTNLKVPLPFHNPTDTIHFKLPKKISIVHQTFQLIQFNFQNLEREKELSLPESSSEHPFSGDTTINSVFISPKSETLLLLHNKCRFIPFALLAIHNAREFMDAHAFSFRFNWPRPSLFRTFRERFSKRRVVQNNTTANCTAVWRDRLRITVQKNMEPSETTSDSVPRKLARQLDFTVVYGDPPHLKLPPPSPPPHSLLELSSHSPLQLQLNLQTPGQRPWLCSEQQEQQPWLHSPRPKLVSPVRRFPQPVQKLPVKVLPVV